MSLRVSLDDDATFDNFYLSENSANLFVVEHLRCRLNAWVSAQRENSPGTVLGDFSWLWGQKGAGRSHLLQAVCHEADRFGLKVFYLDLSTCGQMHPDVLLGLEHVSALCLDELQWVAGKHEWELALFHLYNRMVNQQTPLLVASDKSPKQCGFTLADLQSRLQSAVVFQLAELDDEGKAAALQLRASRCGFELSREVADYLISRSERSTHSLFTILHKLDRHSLETQRKVTIPLVKSLMGW
jgi:DnaA-homolog protein